MTTATQQISSNPSRDFANGILEETNGGLDIFELLHEIAEGGYGANRNDQVTAVSILTDRGLGKCPRQSPATNPDPDPETEDTGDNHVEALHEAPAAESPRLVTQIDRSLQDSFGPPPSAHQHTRHSGGEPAPYPIRGRNPEEWSGASPLPQSLPRTGYGGEGQGEGEDFEPFSIQATIQRHILTITNNGQTLRTILKDIAFADSEDATACPEPRLRITAYHRIRALRILINRLAGTDLLPAHSAVCPDCRRKWSTGDGSQTRAKTHPKKKPGRRMSKVDPEALAEAHAELDRMEEAGILTPDPNAPKIDISSYLPPQDFDLSPYAKEEAAKFWANIELRYERQKQWPAIEERRRKKLEQIYPSHSEDQSKDPPDT